MKEARNQRFREAVNYIIENNLAPDAKSIRVAVNIPQPRFSDLMNGRGNVQVETILELCNKYGVSLEWMFNGKGEMMVKDISYMMEPVTEYERSLNAIIIDEQFDPEVVEKRNGNRYYVYPDGTIKIEVLQVPFPAYATFLEAYDDEVKLHQEFKTSLFTVDHVGHGYYLGFLVKGDSMNGGRLYDTPDKSEVLGREVGRHLWADGFHSTKSGFVLMTKSGIFHKDIAGLDNRTGMLTLKSRNELYEDKKVAINDVYRIFHVVKVVLPTG